MLMIVAFPALFAIMFALSGIIISDTGITEKRFYGKKIFIPWAEVKEFRFKMAAPVKIPPSFYEVKGKNDYIRFDGMIRKRKEIADEIIKRAGLKKSDKYSFGSLVWTK